MLQRERSGRPREKDARSLKSTVVVGKSGRGADSDYDAPQENMNDDSDLDFDSTQLLMQKRQQLQQQLNALEEAEKAEQEDTVPLPVKRPKHVSLSEISVIFHCPCFSLPSGE